ncbi:MAG: hypothetical protein Ct9H300mP6_13440 [Gammaproteobacteria bacterium]|nr:MAG: hypothetical protein Ct9H300mP6_13440 [Gammaproteobacteria bacterium]
MIKKILVLFYLMLFACGGTRICSIAESDRPLFGKIKFWEMRNFRSLYAFRYTFYRNIISWGEALLYGPLTPEAALFSTKT